MKQEQTWAPDINETEFWTLVEKVWDYTVCAPTALYQIYNAVRYLVANQIKGDLIECGVFFGGSVMFTQEVLHIHEPVGERRVYALDTFGGFVSRIGDVDVDYAGNAVCHPSNPGSKSFFAEAAFNMKATPFDQRRLHIVPGDVAKTIPSMGNRAIALLQLDTDTYETTKLELDLLHDSVVKGGIVIIDDYGFNGACAKAVDEFAAKSRVFPMRQDRYGRSWVKVQ